MRAPALKSTACWTRSVQPASRVSRPPSGSSSPSSAAGSARRPRPDAMIALLLSALALQSAQVDSLMAAGRAHFAQRVIGRYAALEDFRAAARLAPTDPEPWYWQMKVGFYLRSDDGDYIAREALLGLSLLLPTTRTPGNDSTTSSAM